VEYPEAGALTNDVEVAGVRRVLLSATQHYLYYRVDIASKCIEVLAVASTNLGEPPKL